MNTVQQLEQQLADAKVLIDVRQSIERLYQNADFKKIIMEGFMVKEAARYIQTAGDPSITRENREDAMNMALASGHLKRFLEVSRQMGAHAERTLQEIEAEINEARAEDIEG